MHSIERTAFPVLLLGGIVQALLSFGYCFLKERFFFLHFMVFELSVCGVVNLCALPRRFGDIPQGIVVLDINV